MSFRFISTTEAAGCYHITFQRDEKRNAFNDAMSGEVLNAIDQAIEQNSQAIILRANPDSRIWSAGHDLSEIHDLQDLVHDRMFDLFKRIISCPVPIISAVSGDVYAGGFIITLLSDLVVATRQVRFFMTSNKMGVPLPRYVYQYAAQVLGLHKAKEMFFTASAVAAPEAYSRGLVNQLVEDQPGLDAAVAALTQAIASCHPRGIAYSKFVLNASVQHVPWDSTSEQTDQQLFQALAHDPSVADGVTRLLDKLQHRQAKQ